MPDVETRANRMVAFFKRKAEETHIGISSLPCREDSTWPCNPVGCPAYKACSSEGRPGIRKWRGGYEAEQEMNQILEANT